jgi:carbon-monoxide dehydrogenase medium subunit
MEEIARRHGDFAVAAVTAVIWRQGPGRIKARIAAAGVGPAPSRLLEVEKLLEEGDGTQSAIEAAAQRAAEVVDPSSDASASAGFRKHLTGVLTARAVRKAMARAPQPS